MKSKEVKKHLFGDLVPYNPKLRIFKKNNIAQIKDTPAKNREDPQSCFGIKCKEVKNTFLET